jgi:hypothetical protein
LQNREKSANIWLVLAIQTVMPVGYTILLLSAKQGREINAMRRVVSELMYQKSSALSMRFECEEVSLKIEFTTLPPKNHNLFVKTGTKRELEKKELRAGGSFTQTYI